MSGGVGGGLDDGWRKGRRKERRKTHQNCHSDKRLTNSLNSSSLLASPIPHCSGRHGPVKINCERKRKREREKRGGDTSVLTRNGKEGTNSVRRYIAWLSCCFELGDRVLCLFRVGEVLRRRGGRGTFGKGSMERYQGRRDEGN